MEPQEIFLTDKPISYEKEDQFQRYNFSKRIAEIIAKRDSSESIIIGLFGAWGEGKTSVLNFIKNELQLNFKAISFITFNPWRYNDESNILLSFFNCLADVLKEFPKKSTHFEDFKNKLTPKWWKERKGSLNTNLETIGTLLQDYGKLASFWGGAKEAVETVGQKLAPKNIEKLKERVESRLLQKKKRIVIFFDDIDRLERDEIHAIFRLVKLTGDFPFITYVLSFDENMVSSVVGERFGVGDKKAGMNFLEKIIQIPIKLPIAQKTALRAYCFKLVDQAITNCKITITEEEARSFANKFISYFLIRLNTPRLAVRFGNALTFSLPLLKDEVNTVDLLLLEAIHVFYPEVYDFVRNQPDYFIGKYQPPFSNSLNAEKTNKFKTMFDEHCKDYSPDEKENIMGILGELFPNLKQGVEKSLNYSIGNEESLYNSKRIASIFYFNRYFSYSVIKGDVSDVAYNELIETIKSNEYPLGKEKTVDLINSATAENFIQKLKYKVKSFDSPLAIKMVKIVGELGDKFPKEDSSFLQFSSPFFQAVYFIDQLVRYQIESSEKLGIIKWITENANPISFAVEIYSIVFDKKTEPKIELLKEDQAITAKILIDRAVTLSENKPVWGQYPVESKYLLGVWANKLGKDDLNTYIKKWIESDISLIISLVRVFAPLIKSSAYPNLYIGDLNNQQYIWLKSTVDIEYIFQKVSQLINYSPIDSIKYKELEYEQTDDNMLIQFIHWYIQDKKNTNSSEDNIKIEQ
jgi:hypothetical protein